MSPPDTASLFAEVRALLHVARDAAARQVNTLLVLTNYEIGRRIVEHEQGGEARAEYGAGVLQSLSMQLTEEFGRGFSVDNPTRMRGFYLAYRERLPKSETHSRISATSRLQARILETQSPESPSLATHARPLTLRWPHYAACAGGNDDRLAAYIFS